MGGESGTRAGRCHNGTCIVYGSVTMEQMRHGPISNSQWHTLYSPSSMFAMEHFYF